MKSPEGVGTLWKSGGFGDQLAWLKADLAKANANRAQQPWIVVGGHRPMYTTGFSGTDNLVWPNATGHLRDAIEDLLRNNGVDVYLSGHVHATERAFPVYRNVTVQHNYNNPPVPLHLVVGAAGNIEGVSHFGPITLWTALRTRDFGYAELTVYNATTLGYAYVKAADGAITDSAVLVCVCVCCVSGILRRGRPILGQHANRVGHPGVLRPVRVSNATREGYGRAMGAHVDKGT